MSNVIEQMPLYANIENAPLIVLSPSSLPFDDNPTEGSHNLVNSNTIYNLSSFVNSVNANTPVGTIIAYAGNETTEILSTGGLAGYIRCNGSEVSRTLYQELFKVIGTTYGAGDSRETFNLPDLQNNFLMGAGTNNIGATLPAALPNITGVGGLWHTQEDSISGYASLQGAIYKYAPVNITRTVSGLFELHNVNTIEELKEALITYKTYPIPAEDVEKIIPNDVNQFVKIPQTGTNKCIWYLRTLYNVTTNAELKNTLISEGMSEELVVHLFKGDINANGSIEHYWYPRAVYTGYDPRWKDIAPAFKDVVNNYIDVNNGSIQQNSFPLAFNASLSNPIYGGSDTVQPPAVAINFYIKYKLK